MMDARTPRLAYHASALTRGYDDRWSTLFALAEPPRVPTVPPPGEHGLETAFDALMVAWNTFTTAT